MGTSRRSPLHCPSHRGGLQWLRHRPPKAFQLCCLALSAPPPLTFLGAGSPGAVFTHTAPPVLCNLCAPPHLLPHLTLRGPSLGSLAIASLGGLSCPESNRNQQGTGSRQRCAHTDWSWARINPGSGFCVPHIIVRSPGDANLEWRPFPPGHTPPVSLCTLRRAHLHSFGWMGWVSPTSHTTPVAKRWGSREPVAGVKGTEFGLRGTGKPVPAVSRGGS